MKKYLSKLVALALFAVALSGAVVAQDSVHTLRANIPFSFYAGSRLLPAGEYTISVNLENRLVIFHQKDNGSSSMLLGSVDEKLPGDRTVLRFKLVDGEVYALSELQGPELGVGFKAKRAENTMNVRNQKSQSAVVIAEAM